jgi:heme A synthase
MDQISGRRKAGYILGVIVGLLNIPGAFVPSGQTDTGSPTGPPFQILIFGVVAGVLAAALLAVAWRRRSRALTRAAAVLMILLALTAVPAFTAPDVPAWIKLIAGAYVLSTLVSLVLLFSPARRPAPVLS